MLNEENQSDSLQYVCAYCNCGIRKTALHFKILKQPQFSHINPHIPYPAYWSEVGRACLKCGQTNPLNIPYCQPPDSETLNAEPSTDLQVR